MDNTENPEITERKQGVAGIFGRAASTYDRVGPRFLSHFGRRLVELAEIPNGASVLDIATGRGAVLFPAAEVVGSSGRVLGIDLSREMVERSREEIEALGLQNAEVREMDAEDLEFPNESFDYILCSFAIFFFPRLDRALAEMYRVLKPNGRIAVTTWGLRDENWKWYDDLVQSYLAPEPEAGQATDAQTAPKHVFDKPEGLAAILVSAGFTDIRVLSESQMFTYDSEEQWWSTLWSHGLRADLEAIEKQMGADGLNSFKADAFRNMEMNKHPEGIHQTFGVLFGLAFKPQG
ncbi:MAG TPA: methyltransferase domain-containing protein [Anaerolineales bacterium]|nr:methyltransferase domain-containing protein [Anaerolineales bacterium]